MSVIDQMISKYGGQDEAYKLKLKTGIRDAFGYSNYMSKLGKETKAPADIGNVEGLSPAGINARISSRFGTQNENISSLSTAAGAIDTAAGTLAAEQAAREKAAREKAIQQYGINNGVMFNPQSQLETKVADYMKNPYNPDGSVKTIDQFKQEAADYFAPRENVDMTSPTSNGGLEMRDNPTAQNIQEVIDKRIPKDFAGNEQTYAAMSQGFSRKQATDPSTSGAVKDAMQTQVDPATGRTVPKYDSLDIQNMHPDLTDAEVNKIMKPVDTKNAISKLNSNSFINNKDELVKLYTDGIGGTDPANPTYKGYAAIMASPDYKALEVEVAQENPSLTAQEISGIIYNYVSSLL